MNRLLDAPQSVAETLDWGIKRALYVSYANSRGVPWDSLPYWTRVIGGVRQVLDDEGQYEHSLIGTTLPV